MAERRSIHRKISTSEDCARLAEACGFAAVVFYTWLFPHFDNYGCVPESPRVLKATIVPMLDGITAADLEAWTEWLVGAGMLERITGPKGDQGLRCPAFELHQDGGHLNRETPSRYAPAEVLEEWRSSRTDGYGKKKRSSSGSSPETLRSRPDPKKPPVDKSLSGESPESLPIRKEGRKEILPSPSPSVDGEPGSLEEPSRLPAEVQELPPPGIVPEQAGELVSRLRQAKAMPA